MIASSSILALAIFGQASTFELKDRDRVLFYGDSITEQRLYTTYVEAFVKTRYPHMKIDFISCGVGGDATWGGWTAAPDERVRRDVKPENPTVVTIMSRSQLIGSRAIDASPTGGISIGSASSGNQTMTQWTSAWRCRPSHLSPA